MKIKKLKNFLSCAALLALVLTSNGAFASGKGISNKGVTAGISALDLSSVSGHKTTATAAGTTTLTNASERIQGFTGTTTQTVVVPVTSTLVAGSTYSIQNSSTGAVTVNSSGGNAIVVLAPNTQATVTCILTSGTTAASWSYKYEWLGAGSTAITYPTAAPLLYPDGFYRYRFTLSTANITAMYATPVLVLAAPGSGKYIVVTANSKYIFNYVAPQFTGGGTALLEYGNFAAGAGTQAVTSQAAAVFTAASSVVRFVGSASLTLIDSALIDNIGIYASNQTAAFATGGGNLVYDLTYEIRNI